MKTIKQYLDTYDKMMYEYLNIYNPLMPEFNQEKVSTLTQVLYDLYADYKAEVEEKLINKAGNEVQLRPFLMMLYVNGYKRISCVLDRFVQEHIKVKKELSELDKDFLDFKHSVDLNCSNLIEYLKLNLKIVLPKIDCNKYNISGNYFGGFEINHLSNSPKPNENQYPFYCKIGVLFAKGQIQFKNKKYYYCNNSYVSIAKLSKHIQDEVLKTNKAVRQYINDTIYNSGTKSFYKSYTMMKNVVDYCNDNNIKITTEFQDIYDELEKLH